MNALFNHLWQSTAFAAVVALAALILRRHSPRLRYWLWLSASAKFLIPFSLILATGARLQLPPDTPTIRATTVQQVSAVFSPVSSFSEITHPLRPSFPWLRVLVPLWLAGVAFLAARWLRRWWRIHRAARLAAKLPLEHALPAYSSPAMIEPGIFGIFRPIILLPDDLDRHLSHEQFEAVLAHESRHARYRDNLTAAFHMLVETLFWFHPLVWWIGARLIEERERDCDEAALIQGSQPGDYARGIVSVCQSYIESPLPCASGISGADLKKRIREIMGWRGSRRITVAGKAALAIAAIAAVSLPFVIGIVRAQSLPAAPQYLYDTVSVRPSAPDAVGGHIGPGPQGGLKTENTTPMLLLTFAYGVRDYQIEGAPGWTSSQRYDITFTPDKPEATPTPGMPLPQMQGFMERNRQRMQAVLRDRFGLVMRNETHQLPVYALTQNKGANKLTPHDERQPGPSLRMGQGELTGVGTPIQLLLQPLSQILGHPVIDETGLTGQYDFHLTWTPDAGLSQTAPDGVPAASGDGASLFTAVTDQLGLKLESKKGPVTVYVIEKIEQPKAN